MLVTVTREQALTAAAALRQTGDEQTASAFERASVQLWVLQGADEDGYNTYLGYNRYEASLDGATPEWKLAGAAAAELFTDEEKSIVEDDESSVLAERTGLDAEELQEMGLLGLSWELCPDEADIADMHDNTDPDRVDEYVTLVGRANELRTRL